MTAGDDKKRWYIYAHKDTAGNVFYVGKGTGRRAWADRTGTGDGIGSARHESWYWYVDKHLKNEYSVEILQDGLTEDEAFDAEINQMGQYDPDTLINWGNLHARFVGPTQKDYAEAQELARQAKQLCRDLQGYKTDDASAVVGLLVQVLALVYEYAPVLHSLQRTGLVRKIQLEMHGEQQMKGEIAVIDRLSFWMKKTGQLNEAGEIVKEYFETFPNDLRYSEVAAIQKRLAKHWIKPD